MGVHFRFQAAHARCTLVHVLSLCTRILRVLAHKVSSHVKFTTTTPSFVLLVVLVREERTLRFPRLDGSGRLCPRPSLVKIENYRDTTRGRMSSNYQRTPPDITTLEFRRFTPFFRTCYAPLQPRLFRNLGARIKTVSPSRFLFFSSSFFSFVVVVRLESS